MEVESVAVAVRGAFKRYSRSTVVLRGLNLTVAEGTIYGLLGPSGCGKTTLLRSIVGLLRLDAGEILVKAGRKSNVGYMPQDIGLYDYMSIMEAFEFYGKLHGMDGDTVYLRGIELVDFLELPESHRLIRTLSPGQQRRLSFAVALIHDPDLLILDEPTVGIDPILSSAIWERMLEMSSVHNKTIIITTHYIEEARQAHTIGLMRDGVLLAEQSPTSLMVSHGCESLEEVFLNLSQKQETSRGLDEVAVQDIEFPDKSKVKLPLDDPAIPFALHRFNAQIRKNVKWLLRYFYVTMLLIGLTACIPVMIQLMLDNNPVTNSAIGIVSPELVRGATSCSILQDPDRPFTCRLMDYIVKSSLVPIVYDNLETAKMAVAKNEAWGVLHFSEYYTASLRERIEFGMSVKNGSVIDASFVECYLDMSNMWMSNMLKRELVDDVKRMVQNILEESDSNPNTFNLPIQYKPVVFGSVAPTFLEFIIPGILGSFSVALALIFSLGAIMFEKNVGFERSLAAGMTKLEVLSAHCVVQLVISILQELVMVTIFYYVYDNPCRGDMGLAFLLLVMLQTMGNLTALVIALTHQGEFGASNTGLGYINVLFLISGMVWPVEGMHTILRSVAWLFPLQPAVESYRGIVMRDWHLSHPVVYKGFLSTIAWCAFLILIIIVLSRRKASL